MHMWVQTRYGQLSQELYNNSHEDDFDGGLARHQGLDSESIRHMAEVIRCKQHQEGKEGAVR